MHVRCNNAVSLLEKRGFKQEQGILNKVSRKGDEDVRSGPVLLCARCGFPITTGDQRITMSAMHEHTFANPHGIIYRIGCFRNAPGCAVYPAEHGEMTWFDGYAWAQAMCAMCGSHMGWKYRREDDYFHGLVLDHLVEKEEP